MFFLVRLPFTVLATVGQNNPLACFASVGGKPGTSARGLAAVALILTGTALRRHGSRTRVDRWQVVGRQRFAQTVQIDTEARGDCSTPSAL